MEKGHTSIKRICAVCGKEFEPAPLHVYKIEEDTLVCTYGCMMEHEREIERRKAQRKKQKRKILQYTADGEFLREWNSIKEAAEEHFTDRDNIANCLCGKYKTSCGFVWRYKN